VVIRIRKSKDRQHNDQRNKDKQRSTKHTHKTKTGAPKSASLGVLGHWTNQVLLNK